MATQDRTHAAARQGLPMTADNARHCIQEIEKAVKSNARRRAMVAALAKHARNLTPDAIAVYLDYSESIQ